MPQHIWNTVIRPARGTAVGRAVALAHSGAGPNALLPTVRWLPEGIEVVGVTLPGRERRIDEDPTRILDDPEGAVAAVAGELRTLSALPTVFFGHSMGAAFAVALALAAPDLCQALVLSAHPNGGSRTALAGQWSEEDLMGILQRGGGTPAEVLQDEYFRAHLLAVLRSDLTLGHRLATRHAHRSLPVPLTVLGGRDDALTETAELTRWSGRARASLRNRVFPGGHFYLLDEANQKDVADEIAGALRVTVAG
ncbi:thioesterase [Streptomyces sp. RPA4-5]|uniref:thioesterase II family protein n=1 Tax=Streptomyces sp. RPA4-5 TaxID=2721245 RepID=UPI00143E9CB7|nr:alpha/beta fold hydrolase [Streptomyces sp. RPA4-5]QIY58998.1 thioesterase [Streptomyces sp. RPA4-5]